MIPWGGDFAHKNAELTFPALEDTIKRISADPKAHKYELKFSSVKNYMEGVKRDTLKNDIKYDVVKDDFWEYNKYAHKGQEIKNSYWTGYFTTYPDFKRIVTEFSDFTQFS